MSLVFLPKNHELARVLLADSLWGANWPGSKKAQSDE